MKVKAFEIVKDQSILENSFNEPFLKIGDHKIDSDRDLTIYTWSKLKNIPVECDILFDLSQFVVQETKSTGLDEDLQNTIQNHSAYNDITKSILKYIETGEYKKIGLICDYGKVVSVAFAELLKKTYYQRTIIYHNNLKV